MFVARFFFFFGLDEHVNAATQIDQTSNESVGRIASTSGNINNTSRINEISKFLGVDDDDEDDDDDITEHVEMETANVHSSQKPKKEIQNKIVEIIEILDDETQTEHTVTSNTINSIELNSFQRGK